MNVHVLVLAVPLALAAVAACSDDDSDSKPSESRNGGPDGTSPTGGGDDDAAASCGDRLAEGEALVQSLQACETDADCIVSSAIVPCVTPCYLPISKDARQSDLNEALAWADAYIEDRCPCAIADCVEPSGVTAVCSGRYCQIALALDAN